MAHGGRQREPRTTPGTRGGVAVRWGRAAKAGSASRCCSRWGSSSCRRSRGRPGAGRARVLTVIAGLALLAGGVAVFAWGASHLGSSLLGLGPAAAGCPPDHDGAVPVHPPPGLHGAGGAVSRLGARGGEPRGRCCSSRSSRCTSTGTSSPARSRRCSRATPGTPRTCARSPTGCCPCRRGARRTRDRLGPEPGGGPWSRSWTWAVSGSAPTTCSPSRASSSGSASTTPSSAAAACWSSGSCSSRWPS